MSVEADLTQAPGAERMVAACLQQFGHVRVLVNAAGGFKNRLSTWLIPEEDWDAVLNSNLKTTFLCCRAVLPTMIERKQGRIINVSSGAARVVTHLTASHYASAKAGVLALTRHLAYEVGSYGITVNAVAPGVTLTARIDRLYDADQKRELATKVPLGRLGLPEDQVGPILFLASEGAEYVTGITVDVAGGRYMI